MSFCLRATVALVLAVWATGCVPSAEVRGERLDEGSRSLTSVAEMTKAFLDIEAALGTDRLAEIAVRFDKPFKSDPQNPFKRCLWAYSQADRNSAWQELSKVTKINDRFYWAYLGMGIILTEWKVWDQAEVNLRRAVELGPQIGIGFARLGRLLELKGDPAGALPVLRQATVLEPLQGSTWLDLARALRDADLEAEAETSFRRTSELLPESFAAHAELAALLQSSDRGVEALEEWKKAAELEPEDFDVRWRRAELLLGLGRLDEAIDAFGEACRVHPQDVGCWLKQASLAKQQGNRGVQISAYEKVLHVDARHLEANAFLAPVYFESGEVEKAQPCYQAVLAQRPDDILALMGLAAILERGEEFSQAIELYSQVRELQPDHVEAGVALSRLYSRFAILSEPIMGKTPDIVFTQNRSQIAATYKERLKANPALQGGLLLKVSVDNEGKVLAVSVARDTVGDPVLDLCASWNLRRSRFPAGYGATYDFELTLKPGDR